jgi:hypothetical protein
MNGDFFYKRICLTWLLISVLGLFTEDFSNSKEQKRKRPGSARQDWSQTTEIMETHRARAFRVSIIVGRWVKSTSRCALALEEYNVARVINSLKIDNSQTKKKTLQESLFSYHLIYNYALRTLVA